MRIGFVSAWFERGAAYVTKAYIDALKYKHDIFVYARGGESYAIGNPKWDMSYVTWGLKLNGAKIDSWHFKQWIQKNKIDVIFFNEQRDIEILLYLKERFPHIKLGTYIDYYTENDIDDFWLYDFLICNTRRHYSVFKEHSQCYYVPWGTDAELYKPQNINHDILTFFHSVGMSTRKGTDLLLEAFINGKLYKESKLIIHSQLNFEKSFGYSAKDIGKYNIELIERTVTAPGLYHLGDVYVYPTTLDGLGLTLYEALSCGLPVITTNNAPMNEVINNNIGFLVDVDKYYTRSDGYYWPLSICNIDSLITGMMFYINNKNDLIKFKNNARQYALKNYNWTNRYDNIKEIFENTKILDNSIKLDICKKNNRKKKIKTLIKDMEFLIPNRIVHFMKKTINN